MSLFGHLALRFGSQPENLATEALGYLLQNSAAARKGLVNSLGPSAPELGDLAFHTQHSDTDNGRPDLAGVDASSVVRLLIEAKFWAGFTDQQPVGYLKSLMGSGVLLVICPGARLENVWRELLRRLDGMKHEVLASPGEVGHAVVGQCHLVLQGWRRVLNAMQLAASGEPTILADLAQLDGLCARMDDDAFVPLTSEELTSNIYRRVHEFGKIADDVVAALNAEKLTSTKGARASAANGWYGRYLTLSGVACMLQVSTIKWTKSGGSPLWFIVFGKGWNVPPEPARHQLAAFGIANPDRLRHDARGYPAVMLRVPVGAERSEVVADVARQIRELAPHVAPLGAGATVGPIPVEGEADGETVADGVA